MADLVIETRALKKTFGANTAVEDLSLSVGRGEVFGFLGPNGAGKTTSVKLLLGLVAPTAGEGNVLGAPLGNRAARAKVGFLPEHCRFHDSLTARELLEVHGRLAGLRRNGLAVRIDALLLRIGLEDAADRPLRTYSKGMMQRAGLAQALIGSPELVFLDEPTSGLDPLGRRLVRDLIDDLRTNGAAVFLNSHLLGEVEATCDRVAFVKRGRVIHELALGAESPTLDVEIRLGLVTAHVLDALGRLGTDVRQEGGIVRLRVDDDAVLPEISRALIECGAALFEQRCRRKTLEEWFVEVMGEDQRPG